MFVLRTNPGISIYPITPPPAQYLSLFNFHDKSHSHDIIHFLSPHVSQASIVFKISENPSRVTPGFDTEVFGCYVNALTLRSTCNQCAQFQRARPYFTVNVGQLRLLRTALVEKRSGIGDTSTVQLVINQCCRFKIVVSLNLMTSDRRRLIDSD